VLAIDDGQLMRIMQAIEQSRQGRRRREHRKTGIEGKRYSPNGTSDQTSLVNFSATYWIIFLTF
jgi:hypothetical protein